MRVTWKELFQPLANSTNTYTIRAWASLWLHRSLPHGEQAQVLGGPAVFAGFPCTLLSSLIGSGTPQT